MQSSRLRQTCVLLTRLYKQGLDPCRNQQPVNGMINSRGSCCLSKPCSHRQHNVFILAAALSTT